MKNSARAHSSPASLSRRSCDRWTNRDILGSMFCVMISESWQAGDPESDPVPRHAFMMNERSLLLGLVRGVTDFTIEPASVASPRFAHETDPAELGGLLRCSDCPTSFEWVFASSKALQTHTMRAHHHKNPSICSIARGERCCPMWPSTRLARDHMAYCSEACVEKLSLTRFVLVWQSVWVAWCGSGSVTAFVGPVSQYDDNSFPR